MKLEWTPEQQAQLLRAGKRSAAWFVAAVVFGLLSLPAFFDLQSLFVGLAVVCCGFGVVTAAFTWFDKTPSR